MKNLKLKWPLITLAAATLTSLSGTVQAQSTVFGEGRTPVGAGDALAIRNAAKQDALRDAVIKAIKDATALDASDPRYGSIISEVAKQLRDVQVREERREGGDFVTRIEALVDRRQIKNAIRGTELDKLNDRSFSMLMLVDEYVTSTRDLNMPLRELTEYNYDAGSSFRDKSLKASASSAASNSAVAQSSSSNAAMAANSRINGSSNTSVAGQASDRYGSGSVAATQNVNVNGQSSLAASRSSKDSYAATASSQASKASVDRKDIDERSHETASYKKLIEYQDTSKPSSKSIFLSAFGGNLRDYDLRIQDSAVARSKFFGDRAISLATLTNSAEMAKFSEFARTKANSDFLLIGNSTVIGGEKNPATGEMSCVVNAEVKAFATASGELISATSESMEASGLNIEACAAIASKRMADLLAPQFAGRALGYWADRAARGRQYTVELKGSSLPLPMRLAFAKSLRDIPGATDVEKKEDSDGGVKVTLTYKGKGDAMEEVYSMVSAHPAFASKVLDGKAEGELLTLCIDKCAGEVAPGKAPEPKSKKK
jgi:hypothetical protein